jgi:hypothetical protein
MIAPPLTGCGAAPSGEPQEIVELALRVRKIDLTEVREEGQ